MSAWLVSEKHINVLITYALDKNVSLHPANDPEGLCRLLTEENMKSLRERYPGRDFLQDWEDAAKTYKFKFVASIRRAVRTLHNKRNKMCEGRLGVLPSSLTVEMIATQIVKACDCYDYQACEHDDYKNSAAAVFIDRLREQALTLGGCSEGKLYNQLMWGLD